jgi:hypothetical protein
MSNKQGRVPGAEVPEPAAPKLEERRRVPGAGFGVLGLFACREVRRDSVELFGRQALAERGHVGVRVD